MRYDLKLFLSLNEEYRSKPLVPAPPAYDEATLTERAKKRADNINGKVNISGKRVLEIGCGRGEVCRALNEHYGCETVGVDVSSYPEWGIQREGVTLIKTDLTASNPPDIGVFDVIYSNSVWEHIRHPFTMLKRSFELLKPGGYLLLSANLYRGPKASHRYREVFFPWPHILFSDDVFNEFYAYLRRPPAGETWVNKESVEPSYQSADGSSYGAAWVNQLSIADYYHYFHLVGFKLENVKFSTTPLDEDFLRRFSDKLDRFPRYDLERDFIHAKLLRPVPERPKDPNLSGLAPEAAPSKPALRKPPNVAFKNDLHRALHQRIPQDQPEGARALWEAFCSKYPEYRRYEEQWIKSREPGMGPLKLGIPWINYPALEILSDFLQGKSTAFEWGMGGSTIFLRRHVDTVISVEHDEKWFSEAENTIEASHLDRFKLRNIRLRYRSRCLLLPPKNVGRADAAYGSGLKVFKNKSFKTYAQSIRPWPDGFFGLVLVDGRARVACCKEAAVKVRPGGILILDNSDYARYQSDLENLENCELSGWHKTEFLGPGPCSNVIGWQTTVWRRPE